MSMTTKTNTNAQGADFHSVINSNGDLVLAYHPANTDKSGVTVAKGNSDTFCLTGDHVHEWYISSTSDHRSGIVGTNQSTCTTHNTFKGCPFGKHDPINNKRGCRKYHGQLGELYTNLPSRSYDSVGTINPRMVTHPKLEGKMMWKPGQKADMDASDEQTMDEARARIQDLKNAKQAKQDKRSAFEALMQEQDDLQAEEPVAKRICVQNSMQPMPQLLTAMPPIADIIYQPSSSSMLIPPGLTPVATTGSTPASPSAGSANSGAGSESYSPASPTLSMTPPSANPIHAGVAVSMKLPGLLINEGTATIATADEAMASIKQESAADVAMEPAADAAAKQV